uniref:Uncharacterized protein n=1 Tax=Siphoviridae sp. ctcPV5 TaxID=2827582 RepID=A0A8S5LKU2_9CAUD|nr:MAG TPA: hypothetical protein [Siphoviridae sp. ctcPV5]
MLNDYKIKGVITLYQDKTKPASVYLRSGLSINRKKEYKPITARKYILTPQNKKDKPF